MNNFDQIEEEAIAKTKNRKKSMKVSGKSVFLLSRQAAKIKGKR